jgi:hypothetical protein
MKQQKIALYKFVLPVLLVITIACSFFGSGAKEEILGEDYTNQYGGFTIGQVNGYSLTEEGSVVRLQAPDASADVGPVIMVTGGLADTEMTDEEYLDKMIGDMSVLEWTKGKKVTINGTKGLLAEGRADYGDQQVVGQLFVAMINPTRQFSLVGFAPMDRWKELEPIIEAVLKSAAFFEINPQAPAAIQAGSESVTDSGPMVIRQWATYAEASSSYTSTDWSAMQAVGEPNVDSCGDNRNAWASYDSDTEEWIETSYDIPVIPTEINIYQTFNPSQVVEVQIIDVDGDTYVAWTGEPESVANCPDLMTIQLEMDEDIYINKVVVFIDQGVMDWGWAEIDAIELVGYAESPAGGMTPQDQSAGQQPAGGQSANTDANPHNPDDLSADAFAFTVSGYENDVVENNNVQYQSTENTYVVAFINSTERYMISLFLPKNDIKQGTIDMVPYAQTQATQDYTAAIYINAFLYIAEGGQLDIQSDPASGKITGTFTFTARSKDYPDRTVTVSGSFKDVPLQ